MTTAYPKCEVCGDTPWDKNEDLYETFLPAASLNQWNVGTATAGLLRSTVACKPCIDRVRSVREKAKRQLSE